MIHLWHRWRIQAIGTKCEHAWPEHKDVYTFSIAEGTLLRSPAKIVSIVNGHLCFTAPAPGLRRTYSSVCEAKLYEYCACGKRRERTIYQPDPDLLRPTEWEAKGTLPEGKPMR